jgi:hypothetical protein
MTAYHILIISLLFITSFVIHAVRIDDSELEKLKNEGKDNQRKDNRSTSVDIHEKLSLRRKIQVTHKCGLNCNSTPQCQGGDRACEWCGKLLVVP